MKILSPALIKLCQHNYWEQNPIKNQGLRRSVQTHPAAYQSTCISAEVVRGVWGLGGAGQRQGEGKMTGQGRGRKGNVVVEQLEKSLCLKRIENEKISTGSL